jgi:acetyl-CoA carboxylase biotin carboxyl carrier protein
MSLDLDQLRALFDLMAEKEITEFEQEEEGVRLRVARGAHLPLGATTALVAPQFAHAQTPPLAPSVTGAGLGVGQADAAAAADDFVDLVSPFVGSFYRSPSPDAPAFVDVGSVVRAGQTLCIIEAMKLMNEIEAECAGTIVEIFAQNGKSVEYGQKLLRIKKA